VTIVGNLSVLTKEDVFITIKLGLHKCGGGMDKQQGGLNHCRTMCLRARLSPLHLHHAREDSVLLRSSILPRWIYGGVRTGTSVPFCSLLPFGFSDCCVCLEIGPVLVVGCLIVGHQ